MNITSAQYVNETLFDKEGVPTTTQFQINAVIDGKTYVVPLCEGNRHYDEIMRQVDAGTLTIQEADSE